MALAETAELITRFSLKDGLSPGLSKMVRNLKGADRAFSNTQASLGRMASTLKTVGIGAAVSIAGLSVLALRIAGDFEAQLNTINTIARTDAAGLKVIGDQIRQIARDTGTSTEDLTAAYYDLLSAGVKTADAQKVLAAANTLAIGGLATTAQTVDLLTTAINAYGGDASKAGQYTDDFAKAIEIGKVKADEIATSFANVGAIAASAGVSVREIAASYGYLTSQGVAASEVTTQMARAIVEVSKPTGDLLALQKKLGKSYADVAREKGLVAALQEMRDDATKAKIPFIELFARVEAYKYALQTTGPKNAGFNAVLRQMGDDAGTASAQMAERQQGLNFQLARLKALAKDAGITIGTALLPKIVPLVEKLNKLITEHQGDIETFGTALASGFERFAAAIQVIDWGAIAGGLGIAAQATKVLVDAFLALPPDVQKLAVAALAVNKLTGGLPVSLVKDFGSLFLRSLTTINAASVTVVGGNVAGGGGAAVAGASRLTSAVRIIGSVAIAGASIYALAETFKGFLAGTAEAQATLQKQVEQVKTFSPGEAINALAGGAKATAGMNAFDALVAGTFGGGQISEAFTSAADIIAKGAASMTSVQLKAAQEAIKEAAQQAQRLGLTSTFESLKRAADATTRALEDQASVTRNDLLTHIQSERADEEASKAVARGFGALVDAALAASKRLQNVGLYQAAREITKEQAAGPVLRERLKAGGPVGPEEKTLGHAIATALIAKLGRKEGMTKDTRDIYSAKYQLETLTNLQKRYQSQGDTKTAASIGRDIDSLKAALIAALTNLPVPQVLVNVTARSVEQVTTVYKRKMPGRKLEAD